MGVDSIVLERIADKAELAKVNGFVLLLLWVNILLMLLIWNMKTMLK